MGPWTSTRRFLRGNPSTLPAYLYVKVAKQRGCIFMAAHGSQAPPRSALDDLDLRAALAAEIGDARRVLRMRVVAWRDLGKQAELAAAGRAIRGIGRVLARIHLVNFT